MKKKKLNHLSLKKRTVSNLNAFGANQTNEIKGGTAGCPGLIKYIISEVLDCNGGGGTDPNTQGCSEGCSAHCEDTMTCPDWSCDCN